MNTRTSLDVRPATDAAQEIELIAGEAAITKTSHAVQQVVVHAGQATMRASKASFSVRRGEGVVGVTCVDGEVDVEGGGTVRSLRSGQRVLCDEQGLGDVVAVDPVTALAWQRGLLIFEDVPLASAIDEINRYRTGRIILTDAKLGGRRIVASFRLDRIDAALDFVTDVLHVPARRLPGGIVLLG
jgi:transmembrane sensor